ncbi:IS1 family transposase [Sphingobacterium humi]|uniref:IS1 family transposase n=1 Tax=Sphingobacterium humi TaxID=1796905 RepID=A0A6N8L224_9SPHI|nr:IS1 family transposase [Sphingobacterium humi]MVZ63770.1 IS1 family transposase [Sphingobacterium humi]
MEQAVASCIRCVGGEKICSYCNKKLIKHGFSKSGKQRYKCKSCGRTQVFFYTYTAYNPTLNRQIVTLIKEGLGIRSIARVLEISTTTLIKRILIIANSTSLPVIPKGKTYEVDEIRTYLKNKNTPVWIVYALGREIRQVVSFNAGSRTNKTLKTVIKTLELSGAKRIYTDKLQNYQYLIDKSIHRISIYGTNHIERMNLTLRTRLKRLNRRTICFSKSLTILVACLRLYFFS